MATKRVSIDEAKERIRRRVRVQIDEDNYEYIPESKTTDYYDDGTYQRVAIYVRVSTDSVMQTTSYELQKKYYEEFVLKHPNWDLVGIYADEGISGTSLKHRDNFNRMIRDAMAGKIDLIITKSVSRFARNVVDFLGMVRKLSEHNPPIGIFFESENVFSLNQSLSMPLSFHATMAEEESRNKSRSMETSLRMRLDHGLPLTPKLLGFDHDENGHLIINPETKHIPELMFKMYLFGFSTAQIAEKLTQLGKKTYLGNCKWTAGGIARSLGNERYMGAVKTRKTFTLDVISHKTRKNRGERPQSVYYNDHEAIVSRDDFMAVQQLLNNSRYRNSPILPELSVIKSGLLKGFVTVNPRWSGFKENEYLSASASAYEDGELPSIPEEINIEVNAGDFDLTGFEFVPLDFFDTKKTPHIALADKCMKFSAECVRRLKADVYVELLINPYERRFAVRPTTKDNRNAVVWATVSMGVKSPRNIPCAAFFDTLFSLFGWNAANKYRMFGDLYRENEDEVFIFNARNAGVFVNSQLVALPTSDGTEVTQFRPVNTSGKRIGIMPPGFSDRFGRPFYLEQSLSDLSRQTKEDWQLRIEGQLFSTGRRLNVTSYEELKTFIKEQLGELWTEEEVEVHE